MAENAIRQPPIREDMVLQRRVWRAERTGWVVMALLLLAALLGAFSHGLLSDATVAGSDGNLRVDYERFAHKTARSHFVITLARAPQEAQIRLSPSFLQFYDIEMLYPEAVRSSAGAGGLDLVFAPSAAGDLSIHIAVRPKRFGIASLAVEANGQERTDFTQFIYP